MDRGSTALHGVPDFAGPVFVTGFLAWGGLTIVLQAYRIIASIGRGRLATPRASRPYWNLQTSLQFKILVVLFLVPAAAWLWQLIAR